MPVLVQPVDERYHPIGEPFSMVTRDVSPSGVGLVHSEPIRHKFLALQMLLNGERVNFVIKVVWNMGLGPFYGAGGEFVAKLESFP
jgi:hypothetical protein